MIWENPRENFTTTVSAMKNDAAALRIAEAVQEYAKANNESGEKPCDIGVLFDQCCGLHIVSKASLKGMYSTRYTETRGVFIMCVNTRIVNSVNDIRRAANEILAMIRRGRIAWVTTRPDGTHRCHKTAYGLPPDPFKPHRVRSKRNGRSDVFHR